MKLLGRAAQMHVLEVLLVATLFTSAVNVAVISLPASDATRVGDDNLRYQGMQLLQVLDEWQTGAGESTLATWLSEDNSSALQSYLDGGLPAAASYRLTGAHGGSVRCWSSVARQKGRLASPSGWYGLALSCGSLS